MDQSYRGWEVAAQQGEVVIELTSGVEEALVRAILDNVADGLLTFDETGHIAACNPAAERLFGYRTSEVIGEPLTLLIPESYPGEPLLGMVRPQQPNAPDRRSGADRNAGFRRERECRRRDGSTFPAELHIGAMPLSDRLWYVASVRGGDARLAAEAIAAEQAAMLRERSHLLDLASDALIGCDLLGQITVWNAGATALYGWQADEVRERDLHDLLQTQFPDSAAAALQHLLATDHWAGDLIQQHRDGTTITVASRWSLRRDKQGEPIGIALANRRSA